MEVDHSRMISLNADGDKATSLSFGVYEGNVSAIVFSNKAVVAKFSINDVFLTKLISEFESLLTAAPGTKKIFTTNKYNMDTKKMDPGPTMVVGRDDKSLFYFGIQAPSQSSYKFTMKAPASFDMSPPMDDTARSLLAFETNLRILQSDIVIAKRVTYVKKTGGNNGNNNRSNTTNNSSESFTF